MTNWLLIAIAAGAASFVACLLVFFVGMSFGASNERRNLRKIARDEFEKTHGPIIKKRKQ